MANMTFKASLLPNSDLGYSLGSDNPLRRWKIYGQINTLGADICLNTNSSSSNDSGDIVFFYGNKNEKARIWTADAYTASSGPYYRVYKEDGTLLTSTTLSLATHTHDDRYVTLSTAQTITGAKTFSQPIYFATGGGTTRAILAYDASNLGFGITYKEGNPDVMTFSASGNANNMTNADLSINGLGDGKVSIRGKEILHTGNYTSYTVTKTGSGASGTWGINVTGNANTAYYLKDLRANVNTATPPTYGAGTLEYFNTHSQYAGGGTTVSGNTSSTPTADWYYIIRMNHQNGNGYYGEIATCFHNNNMYFRRVASGSSTAWLHIWVQGNAVTGAVWNDYAEYRETKDCDDFGYVVFENGDDTLSKTTERLQHFAGITSDTWGFAQGQTNNAKTPIAVAGRVLAYPYQDRNSYKPGDCLCAAPGGTVDIMTREEVCNWPDRIVGTVSCVPDYEEWGEGEDIDRPPVKVNGRIWVKVR